MRIDFTRLAYLLLTLAALAFPVRRFALWFAEHGFDIDLLIENLTVNDPARGVTTAIVIASAATLIFIVGEASLRRDWLSLIAIPVTLVFGVGVGLPFYLFLRLRRLDR
ncbi:MAG: DUF2834 domain-containing protein [Pseudomonadota bacterium]